MINFNPFYISKTKCDQSLYKMFLIVYRIQTVPINSMLIFILQREAINVGFIHVSDSSTLKQACTPAQDPFLPDLIWTCRRNIYKHEMLRVSNSKRGLCFLLSPPRPFSSQRNVIAPQFRQMSRKCRKASLMKAQNLS